MRGRDDSGDSAIAKEYSKKSSFARHAQSPSSIGQSAFGEGAKTNTLGACAAAQSEKVRFGETPKSEHATASLRPDWYCEFVQSKQK